MQKHSDIQPDCSIRIPQVVLQQQLSGSARTKNSREKPREDENGTFSPAPEDYSQNSDSTEVTAHLLGRSQSLRVVAVEVDRDQGEQEDAILGGHEHKGPPGPAASLQPGRDHTWPRSLRSEEESLAAGAGGSSCALSSRILAAHKNISQPVDPGAESAVCHRGAEMGSEMSQTLIEVLLITLGY